LLMSKVVFDSLPAAQQKAIVEVGLELESFATKMAKEDDIDVAVIYKKAGAKVADMDDATINRWREMAQKSAWLDFSNRSPECDRFLKMAQAVS